MTDTDYKKMWRNEQTLRVKAQNYVNELLEIIKKLENGKPDGPRKIQTNRRYK